MREGSASLRTLFARVHLGQAMGEGLGGLECAAQERARFLLVACGGKTGDGECRLLDPYGPGAVAERIESRFLRTQSTQAPARVHDGAAEQPGELLGLDLVEQTGCHRAPAQQAGVKEMDGGRAQVRHGPAVRGTGCRGPAASAVVEPEVLPERGP